MSTTTLTKIESRCGIECSKCPYKESHGCEGCINIKNPFWGECLVKKCSEGKELSNCGECEAFPCETLNAFAFDKEQGDNGQRIETCKIWCNK